MWKYLNKGISTLLAIGIILILAIILGSFTLWQFSEIREERNELFEAEVSLETEEEIETDELLLVEKQKELKMDWTARFSECGEEIIWAKVIDIDNDSKNEMIVSCSLADKIFIFEWKDNDFIVRGELPKEIEINSWNKYEVNPKDFGGVFNPKRVQLNMIYSPSGGTPSEGKNEESIWMRIKTFEWDNFYKLLQFKTMKSLLGGISWYIGDVNNDDKDELLFFARPDPEKKSNSYFIKALSWNGEEFVSIGAVNVPELWSKGDVFIADSNNNGIKEIIIKDGGGWWYLQGGYVYYRFEWDNEKKEFKKLEDIDEKITGEYDPKAGKFTWYNLKAIGDFNGDGENELITQLLPQRWPPQLYDPLPPIEELEYPFYLVIFKWNKDKEIYKEIFKKDFSEYGFEKKYGILKFLDMGDVNNDGIAELIFKDNENKIILFSYREIQKETDIDEQKLAENTINKYVKALMSGSREEVIPYLFGEAKIQFQKKPLFFGTSNPYLGSFEILNMKKLDNSDFEYLVREYEEYEEYSEKRIIGYKDETLILGESEGKYLIKSIKTGPYIDIGNPENWETYVNNRFGYQIKYPKEIFVQIPGLLAENKDANFYINAEDSVATTIKQSFISVQVGQNSEKLELFRWAETSNDEVAKKGREYMELIGGTNIGGKQGVRIKSFSEKTIYPPGTPIDQRTHNLISFDDKVVMVSVIGTHKKFDLIKISEKMLSTFKFID